MDQRKKNKLFQFYLNFCRYEFHQTTSKNESCAEPDVIRNNYTTYLKSDMAMKKNNGNNFLSFN